MNDQPYIEFIIKKVLSPNEDNTFFFCEPIKFSSYLKLQSYLSKSEIHVVKREMQSVISRLLAISIV